MDSTERLNKPLYSFSIEGLDGDNCESVTMIVYDKTSYGEDINLIRSIRAVGKDKIDAMLIKARGVLTAELKSTKEHLEKHGVRPKNNIPLKCTIKQQVIYPRYVAQTKELQNQINLEGGE